MVQKYIMVDGDYCKTGIIKGQRLKWLMPVNRIAKVVYKWGINNIKRKGRPKK